MRFTIESEKFQAVVNAVEAEMDGLRRQVGEVSACAGEAQACAVHPGLRAALTRLAEEFTDPLGASAVGWADAVVREGGAVVVSYRDFDDEAARRADEEEVA